ncbi:MAG: hypothetical protein JSR27_01825 [Proteobacteria bacterium]|nr:hypothetical protein [Pseudomonadota bacterium]
MFRHCLPTVLSISLLAVSAAHADTPMVAQPLAPSTQAKAGAAPSIKPAAKLRLPPPTISVTRLVRQPDGSLRMQCDQEPNPRAKITLPPDRSVSPEAQVQP